MTGRDETSVHRVLGRTAIDVWLIGRQYVQTPSRVIKARGTGPVASLQKQKLSLDVNGPPSPIHADIVDWPDEKHEQKQRAIEFANDFVLEMAPP